MPGEPVQICLLMFGALVLGMTAFTLSGLKPPNAPQAVVVPLRMRRRRPAARR